MYKKVAGTAAARLLSYSNPVSADITDFTSELSDTDEKPNSVKFTWRFAENRPKVNIPTTPGIFNDKFQPPFS